MASLEGTGNVRRWLAARLPFGNGEGSKGPELTENGRFQVGRTESAHRRAAGAEYVACVSKSVKSELGLGSHVVATRRFDTGETPPQKGDRMPVLRARCRLTVREPDAQDEEKAMLDQTVRNALGIPFQDPEAYKVDLGRLDRPKRRVVSDRLGAWLLRRRAVFMRVCSADPGDMEKELARIPVDVFPLLSARPGERIVITHPVRAADREETYTEKQSSLQAYALTVEIVERRRRGESAGLYDRYPDAASLLGVSPDLAPIYLDRQARDDLQARSLEVVRVRRDDANAFLHRIRTFGIALVGASIAIVGVFPIHKTVWNGVWVLLGALVAAIAISIISLRASAGGTGE